MRRLARILIPGFAALLLAACGGANSPPPGPTTHTATPARAATRIATPFDPLLQDEQRARNVQNIVNRQAARQRKAIDQQSQ